MRRSSLAYLSDIVTACEAIAVTLDRVDLPAYEANRTLRSAVEREFTIIGFRNQLVHDYPAIIDATVWAIALNEAPILQRECGALVDELRRAL